MARIHPSQADRPAGCLAVRSAGHPEAGLALNLTLGYCTTFNRLGEVGLLSQGVIFHSRNIIRRRIFVNFACGVERLVSLDYGIPLCRALLVQLGRPQPAAGLALSLSLRPRSTGGGLGYPPRPSSRPERGPAAS